MIELLVEKFKKIPRLGLLAIMLFTACVPAATQSTDPPSIGSSGRVNDPQVDTATPSAAPTATVDSALSNIPFVPMLPKDAIRPIYEPDFVSAAASPLHEDELVMGVAIRGEAKAYPITVLRFREMVNDELAGLPILVTW